jgi:hypothetical protein
MTESTTTTAASTPVADSEWGFMLDTETVGLGETAGVLEMAIVPFLLSNPLAHYPGQVIQLSLQPQLDMGRTLDGGTLKFWLDQPKEAQAPLVKSLDGGDRESVRDALQSFGIWAGAWAANATKVELWSKGAGFDTRIAKNLFAQFAVEWPFHFRSERDLRTLMAMAGIDSKTLTRRPDEPEHNALGDCRFQIRQFERSLGNLRGEFGDLPNV